MSDLSLTAQRVHAEHALAAMREAYPGMVARGRLTAAEAAERLALQEALIATLRQCEEAEALAPPTPAQQALWNRLRFRYGHT
jgi:hypothetical protein